jgi:hypothetical protein
LPRPESYAEVRIEDVDRAVLGWFRDVVDAHVTMPGDRRDRVPVMFGSKERWAADGVAPRDKDGRLILPVLVVTRTSLDPTNGMLALGSNVPRLQISRKISNKSRRLSRNREELPIAQRGPEPVVYEVTTIPFPFNGTVAYSFKIWTQYETQMNEILEKILASLEFYDVPCFVAPIRSSRLPSGLRDGEMPSEVKTADDAPFDDREPLADFYVCGYFDSAATPAGNSEDSTEQERTIKYEGTFTVPLYLQLDPEGKGAAARTELTAFKLGFGVETVRSVDDPEELELIFTGRGPVERLR